MKPLDLPSHYPDDFYNWKGTYYYEHHPCEEVDTMPHGQIIKHIGDRFSSFDLYDNGHLLGANLSGRHILKINYNL